MVVIHKQIPFGSEMLKEFLFDKNYRNLNHGSWGTYPIAIRNKLRASQEEAEAMPDIFLRYTYPELLDQSRAVLAANLNAPMDEIVLVPNATTAINTVLRNLVWDVNGRDEILFFNTIYAACGKTIEYICDSSAGLVKSRKITLQYPIEDEDLLAEFRRAITKSRDEGNRPRLALFDTISSLPGVRVPFEGLTRICREEGIFSLIDGAHGIGHIPIDLASFEPDFFATNCHKWLYVPRSCAVFYVPLRNQHHIRSSLPTSHGYQSIQKDAITFSPLPPTGKSYFVSNFQFTGTSDVSAYVCAVEALKWRKEACGGEENIMAYCRDLARRGGARVAAILETEVLDNSSHSITDCCMVNVRLPLVPSALPQGTFNTIHPDDVMEAEQWMLHTMTVDYKTFMAVIFFQGVWWARLSAQVYLTMEDFEWAAIQLEDLCMRAARGDFKSAPSATRDFSLDLLRGDDFVEH